MNEVARIATEDVELRPMLQRITDALASKFNWEFVALVTIDHELNAFLCEAVTSSVPTDIHVGYTRPLGSGVVGQVAATGEPVIVDDVRTWPNYVETMKGAEAEICVPVRHRGRTVAVLNLESTRKSAFHGQLPLLTTVADQIAGAIANAQMVAELRQRAQLMEMMSEVSRTALEATDLRELLDRVVAYIQERFPLELSSIVMYDAESREFVRAADNVRSGATSQFAVPIRFQGEVLGALNLESASPDVFRPANVLAFEAFADQVAGAIHMASVNGRLAETTRLLEMKTRALEEANEHLAGAIETLHRISTQDGLTGVSNRRHFDETLATEWRRAARKSSPIALLLLDIDFFKAFNDSAGHQAGDDCLRRVAQTLRESVHRAADLVARYGGEEFAVLLPDTDEPSARVIAEALRHRVEEMGMVTVSIGTAAVIPPRDSAGVDDLIARADAALYQAKRAGRNRVA
ncbi:MAG TPA: sensor domain-containing diguanylate cyclase [Thermoanaerobaculia bacterium]|nr:sensor domain-containing diguanylate cyclase [Thermoanaerobaculia bacterium]